MARAAEVVAAVDAIVTGEEEADEILRATVATLAERYEGFAGIRFVEGDELVLGPAAGAPSEPVVVLPVRFRDALVAELVSGVSLTGEDLAAWVQIADVVSAFCLVGWDTGGEGWDPDA